MTFWTKTLTLSCATLLVTSCAITGQQNSSGQQTRRDIATVIEDEQIELDAIKAIFNNDELWSKSDIDIVSFNKTILLVGQTPTLTLKQRAESLVKQAATANRVFNEIRVAAPTSSLTYFGDLSLTSKVKTALFIEDNFDSTKVKVVTEDSEVFLLGLVSKAEAEKAISITRNVSGVKRVIQAFEIID